MVVLSYGLIFYWISWLLWIIVTFFMKKGLPRTILACWILGTIIFSNIYFTVDKYNILVSFSILLIGISLVYTKLPNQLYHLFSTFTIIVGYAAILIWKSNTPLWLFMPEYFLVPLGNSLLIFFLINGLYNRLITGIFGITLGELFYSFILSSYNIENVIGDMYFFDNLYITILILFFLSIIQKGNRRIYSLLYSYKRLLKLQNQ